LPSDGVEIPFPSQSKLNVKTMKKFIGILLKVLAVANA